MPGSGNKGDRGDGMGGMGGGGFGGGGGLGGGGVGRDTVSNYGGNWGRMGNFRGDPSLGAGPGGRGAVGFSGIGSLAAALAAERQNPGLAQQSGLSDAINAGMFGGRAPTGMSKPAREGMPPNMAPPAVPPTVLRPPPTPPMFAPPPTVTPPTFRPPQFPHTPTPPPNPPAVAPPPSMLNPRPPNVTTVPKNQTTPTLGDFQRMKDALQNKTVVGKNMRDPVKPGYEGVSPKGDFSGINKSRGAIGGGRPAGGTGPSGGGLSRGAGPGNSPGAGTFSVLPEPMPAPRPTPAPVVAPAGGRFAREGVATSASPLARTFSEFRGR